MFTICTALVERKVPEQSKKDGRYTRNAVCTDEALVILREKVKLQREEASGFAEEIKKQMAAKRRLAEERLAAKSRHGGGDRRVRGGADAGGDGEGGGAPAGDGDGDEDSDDSGRGGGERGQRAQPGLLRRKKRKTVFM